MTELIPFVEQAAGNIARSIGIPASRSVTVLYSPSKAFIANAVTAELRKLDLQVRDMLAVEGDESIGDLVTRILRRIEGTSGYIVLLDTSLTAIVFEVLGRPDQGIKLGSDHLFCDWFIGLAGLIRTYAVDVREQERFRSRLLAALSGRSIRVTTRRGTDITIVQRHWTSSWGEVYTAPLEGVANGTIVIDGCLYYGPAQEPIRLQIRDGRVASLEELNQSDPQQKMLWQDLTCDGTAPVLAEVGIGISLGADRNADIMEAEQARGTCHFGFGNNVPYGGRNISSFHGDVGVMDPTIEVDGKVICSNGELTDYLP